MTFLFDAPDPDPADGAQRHNVFFALRPDAPAAEAACRLAEDQVRRRGLTGPVMPAERLHVSLNSLGAHHRLPQGLLGRATAAIRALRQSPFLIAFHRFGTWGRGAGPRAAVLQDDDGVIGARRLHADIHAALVAGGLARRRERPIAPHMTLLRDARVLPETPIAPIRWRVSELLLLDSLYGERRQEVLGRWPLIG